MKYTDRTIIQIGSHIGNTKNDPIYKKVDPTTTLILVEPVPYLFDKLKQNYEKKNISNIHFINKAVSNYIGKIELTIPSEKNDFCKLPKWVSQLSSVNEAHIKSHVECKDVITEKINVQTTTVDEIIKEYGVKEIELLHTDTEGHDYEILMSYSFDIKPRKILFEHKHMDGTFKIGKRYELLKSKLISFDYKYSYHNTEDTMFQL
tara:strand:+ start:1039 stop:1653 length:615 start_codon:yes stop_codon:yes gene_type:complete